MISQDEAIAAAKKRLDEMQMEYGDREVSVTEEQVYKVVFSPPPRMRAGDFTLYVDRETGDVVSMRLER